MPVTSSSFRRRQFLAAVIMAFAFLGAEQTHTQDCPDPRRCIPVQRGYLYDIEIVDVRALAPAIVEHEPIEVSYQLSIRTFGLVGDLPALRPLRVCPERHTEGVTTCVDLPAPRRRQTYRGKVTSLAPAAGRRALVTLNVLQAPGTPGEDYGWPAVGSDDHPVGVAARYEVAIESFETLHTRSAVEDTVRLNLQAMIKSDPPHRSDREDACGLEDFTWCRMNVDYGDVKDGMHAVGNVQVGPYLLTPEVEQDLRVLYTVYNFGDSYAQALGEAIANGFSKAGMLILMGAATTGSGVAQPLDAQMAELHKAAFAGCDGLLAVDARTLLNQTLPENPGGTLDALTRSTGVYRPGPSQIYAGGEYRDGNTRCGSGGQYRVSYVVFRTSWRPAPPF